MTMIVTTSGLHGRMYSVCKVGVHKAHEVGHATYLGMVAVEAHGHYRYAAAVLLVVMVLGWFFGDEEEGRKHYAAGGE
jgi:hypothetical protein